MASATGRSDTGRTQDHANQPGTYRFDAFASYATAPDKRLVRSIETFLESFHTLTLLEGPKLRPLNVFIDGPDAELQQQRERYRETDAGLTVGSFLEDYLKQSRYLLLFCSANSARSKWVDLEVAWFLEHRSATDILIAITEGEDPSGRPDEIFSPRMMAHGLHLRPAWYDFRECRGRHAKRWAKVLDFDEARTRLAANLNDRPPGEVLPAWFRAKQHQQRRTIRAWSSVAVVLFGLFVFALVQWRQAELGKWKAQSQKLAAQAQRSLQSDPERGVLLGRAAFAILPTSAADDAVRQALLASRVRVRLAFDDEVRDVALSREGTRLVAASGRNVWVWDPARSMELRAPLVHDKKVLSVSISPDGNRIATGSTDRRARVWSWNGIEWALAGPPLEHEAQVTSVAFSPDGRLLATGSADSTAKLWRVRDGQLVRTFPHDGEVEHVAFSRDGQLLGVAGRDASSEAGQVRVWQTRTGQLSLPHPLPLQEAATSIAFNPSGTMLLVASGESGLMGSWNGGSLSPRFDRMEVVKRAAFDSSGKRVVTAGSDGKAVVWDVGKQKWFELSGHEGDVVSAVFSADGRLVVTASNDRTVRVWAVERDEGVPVIEHERDVLAAAFAPDGGTAITGGADHRAVLRDGATGKLKKLKGHTGAVAAVAFSRDGLLVATGSRDTTARIWDVATRAQIGELEFEDPVSQVAFDCRHNRLAAAAGNWVAVSDAHARLVGQPLSHAQPVLRVAFRCHGEELLSVSGTGLQAWDPSDGSKRGAPVGAGASYAVFSHDGALALLADQRTAQLWDTASRAPVGRPLSVGKPLVSAAISPDGQLVATATAKRIQLWRVQDGARISKSFKRSVTAMAFSRDGKLLATGEADGMVRVRATATGKRVAKPEKHDNRVTFVGFSSDDQWLLIAGDSKKAKLLPRQAFAPIDEVLTRWVPTHLTRALTVRETQDYLPVESRFERSVRNPLAHALLGVAIADGVPAP